MRLVLLSSPFKGEESKAKMAYETCPRPYGSQVAELEFELKVALEGEGCKNPEGAY